MATWVASVDASWWGTAWVADLGHYAGGDALVVPDLPADSGDVQFWVATFSGDLTTTTTFTSPYAFAGRRRLNDGSIQVDTGTISASGVNTATAHLFVIWYDPDYPSDPADLTAPSVTPDSLVPNGYVALPPTGSATVDLGGLTAAAVETDRPTAALYDTDGTWIAALPLAAGIQWQDEVSAPGALSLRLPLDDATTALVTPRRILKVSWRGKERQAARVDSSSTSVAVDGRAWREWTNLPGIMSILASVPVYPEYGLDRTSSGQRTFGYMSRYGHGVWLDESGNFTPAIGVRWSAMTGARAGKPEGLDFPNPYWIAKRGPNADEPPNSYQYFRRLFDTTRRMQVQILATGDNYLELWLDGEKIVDSAGQNQFTWRNVFQVTQTLQVSPPGGRHTLAARVRNNRDTAGGPNHMGLLFTMQEVDASGEVIQQPPIINSDSDWIVSDIAPGFQRAEILIRLYSEGSSYGYGACDLLPLHFSTTRGTDGELWAEDPAERTLDVGSSVLDAIAAFTEKDVDINVDPATLRLCMWNRRGADLSGTVHLTLGSAGGGLISHQVDRIEPGANTIIMQLADGRWMQREDADAVEANGREAVGLSIGSTTDTKSAYQVADAQLIESSRSTITFTTDVASTVGPQLYVNFGPGDTVTVPNENGTGTYAVRVMAATVDASSDGPVKITVELVLDASATPPVITPGGPGTDDPGDVQSPPSTPTPVTPPTGTPAKPTAANTGVSSGVTLATYPATGGPFGNIASGVLTISTNNVEIHGWDFPCRIDVAASGVHIHDNKIRGHANLTKPRGLINCLAGTVVDCLIENNELICQYPNINWQGGVLGHDYTARANNVAQTVDGFGIYNSSSVKTYANVILEQNYVHDLSYFSPDPTHASDVPSLSPVSKTHNDDQQLQGGLNFTARWNNFEGTCSLTIPAVTGEATGDVLRDSSHKNSAGGYNVFYPSTMAASTLQATASVAPIGNLIFEDNWCGQDIKIHAACPGSSVARNKFSRGRDGSNAPQIILTGVGSGLTWAGNVFADNAAPVQVIKDGVVQ